MSDAAAPAASLVAPFLAVAHRRWLADDAAVRWRRRPASLVCARVSALTELSDRLAAQSQASTGELTELLDGALGRLLDTAAAHGGDLLKYGGDTVLLAFEGPGHERRATQAAAALPTALRGFSGDALGGEPEGSLGVATGELDLFLVGDDHRELVVCGPLVSTAVRLEREAGAGGVVADGTTAAAVNDARWSGRHGGGHVLLLPPPASTVGLGLSAGGVHELSASELLRGIPTGVRGHLGSGAGSHRPVAVACIQVSGIDELLERSGHAVVADALDDVIGTAQAACAAHRTTFLATGVDDGAVTVTIAAGAPGRGADGVGRLLLAARSVVASRGGLTLRAGVHHGRALAVEVGSARRRVHTILGDAVTVSARLMRRAEPGVVLVTDSGLAMSRTRFEARPVQPVSANGGPPQVEASAVGAPLGERAYRSGAGRALVGRDHERRALLAALDDVRGGVGRIVVLTGDAGIGKSRLVAEVVAAATDLPRLHAAGGASALDRPYGALRAPMRRLLNLDAEATDTAVVEALVDVVGPTGEQWLPLLAPAFGTILPDSSATAAVEARFRGARSHALLATLLRRLLPDRALLVVEDAQWLDHASTQLLRHLLGAPDDAPWLVLVSRRDEPGGLDLRPSEVVTHLALDPLGPEDAAALLEDAGPDTLPETVLAALVGRGGGNPLLLEQLRAAVVAGAEVDDLPATVETVVSARIDALDRARRRQLRTAAVLGQRFPADQLARLLEDPDVAPGSLTGWLEPDEPGWLRFTHPLVWDRAYAGLSPRSRRGLHDRAAELIEADPSAGCAREELLSLHWIEAQRWASGWRWSVLAAQRAAAMGASVEAAIFLHRAVRAAGHLDLDPAELCRVFERLADAEELNGHLDAAADALTRARRLADDPLHVARLLRRHGRISDRAGSYVAAQRWFARGLRELSSAPQTADTERARIDLVISQAATKLRQGRLREATGLLEEAAADAAAIGHRRATATASNLLSTIGRS